MVEYTQRRQPYKTVQLSNSSIINYFVHRRFKGESALESASLPGLTKMFWADRDFVEAQVDGKHLILFRQSPEELDFNKATARVITETGRKLNL
jgi:hypothetical protein